MSRGSKRSRKRSRIATSASKPKQLVLFVEGGTEKQYINAWHRLRREHVNIEWALENGVPKTLAQAAAKRKRSDKKKIGQKPEYWIVFDCDDHPAIPEALQIARDNDIKVAFTIPCIELWFVLHFQEQNAFISSESVQRLAKSLLGCEKTLSQDALLMLLDEQRFFEASSRASKLYAKHEGDGLDKAWELNPSTNLGDLIRCILIT